MTSTSEQTSASKREPGYYWVNSDFKKEFRPRYWNGNLWFVGMDVYVGDEFWQEIDERRIIRNEPEKSPPHQQPEDEYTLNDIKYHNPNYVCQPDELSKAQARIRELDRMLEQFVYYGTIHTVRGVVPADFNSHEGLITLAKNYLQNK